jgi:hypothetical protein
MVLSSLERYIIKDNKKKLISQKKINYFYGPNTSCFFVKIGIFKCSLQKMLIPKKNNQFDFLVIPSISKYLYVKLTWE